VGAAEGIGRRGLLRVLFSGAGLALSKGTNETIHALGSVRRLTEISGKPFEDVVAAFEAAIGHPDMGEFLNAIGAAKTNAEMEGVVHGALGKSGFMQFARFDLGAVVRKETGLQSPKIVRYLVGNPLIMREMVKRVPDAGSYAPVTVLIDERSDGVHLSYDLVASFLESYGNSEAIRVARDLDGKVESLLKQAAA